MGDCSGVDRLVVNYCIERRIPYTIFEAKDDWKVYGLAAGPMRNERMIKGTRWLIAFPDKDSRGTVNAIKIAKRLKINHLVVHV